MLATLHTNDAAGAIPRLLDMGAEPFLVAAVLNGVAAQRLVRRLCPHCRKPATVPVDILTAMAAQGIEAEEVCEATGCEHCRETGYHGRTVVAELLTVTEEIRALIRSEPDTDRIRAAALEGGMRPMHVDGLAKAARGETSLDEVIRAVGRIPA